MAAKAYVLANARQLDYLSSSGLFLARAPGIFTNDYEF